MPSSLVQYQHCVPARRNRLADFLQVKRHGFCIGIRQNQAHSGIPLRTDGAKDIGRLGLLLPHDPGSCSLTGPNPGQGATLAYTHFILKPHIDLLKGDLRRQNGLHFLEEVFF